MSGIWAGMTWRFGSAGTFARVSAWSFPIAWDYSQNGSFRVVGLLIQQIRAPRMNVPENKLGTVRLLQLSMSYGLTSIVSHWSKPSQVAQTGTWMPLSLWKECKLICSHGLKLPYQAMPVSHSPGSLDLALRCSWLISVGIEGQAEKASLQRERESYCLVSSYLVLPDCDPCPRPSHISALWETTINP